MLHIFLKSRAFFGILLLFCLLGTLIDLVIEEQKELNASNDLVHLIDGMTEPTTSQPNVHNTVCDENHQNMENVTHDKSDDYPLLSTPNTTFSPPGNLNRNLKLLSSIILTLWSKLHQIFGIVLRDLWLFNHLFVTKQVNLFSL